MNLPTMVAIGLLLLPAVTAWVPFFIYRDRLKPRSLKILSMLIAASISLAIVSVLAIQVVCPSWAIYNPTGIIEYRCAPVLAAIAKVIGPLSLPFLLLGLVTAFVGLVFEMLDAKKRTG